MNKIAKNYFYNLSYQILVLIVPLITTPYVSRVLGAKGIGIFSYTHSIVQYFILFGCVGLNLYGQREIAYCQHDEERRNSVFWELVFLRIVTIAFSLIVFYNSLVLNGEYSNIFLLMTIDIVSSMVDISWFFQGIEDFKKIVIRNFIIKIVGVSLIFVFIRNSSDLWLYVLCNSLTLFLGNLSMWLYIPRLVKKVNIKKLHIVKHLKPTIVLFLPQIATSIYTVLDKTMIGYLTGIEEEVAYYEQSQKIIRIVMALVTSFGTVMLPRVANLFKLDQTKKIKDYLFKSFNLVFFLSFPMSFGLIGISSNLVPWFFGDGYSMVIPNMITIAPVIIFISLSNILGTQYLLPVGRQNHYTISVVMGCIVNFVLNIVLIPNLYSIGAAVATLCAEFTVTLVQAYFVRNEFQFNLILKCNYKYIICSIIMLIPIFILSRVLTPSFINTVICSIIGIILYIGILLLVKDDLILEFFYKIKQRKIKS